MLKATFHVPGGAAIVGTTGAGIPRPAARPTPGPGAALAPRDLAFSYKKNSNSFTQSHIDSLCFVGMI